MTEMITYREIYHPAPNMYKIFYHILAMANTGGYQGKMVRIIKKMENKKLEDFR
jgi:hypothetical protein